MICVPLFQLSPRKHSPGSEAWHRDRWTGQGRGEGREVMCNSPCSQQVSYAGRRTSTRIYTLSFKSSAGGLAGLPAQAGTILREIPYISPDGHPRWVSSVQSFSRVWFFETPWTAALQASLPITNSWSLLKLMSIELVIPSNHLILSHPLLLSPSIFPILRVFSSESVLCIRWPKYWSLLTAFESWLCHLPVEYLCNYLTSLSFLIRETHQMSFLISTHQMNLL